LSPRSVHRRAREARSALAEQIEAKWVERHRESRRVRRGIVVGIVVVLLVVGIVGGFVARAFSQTAMIEHCRRNLRQLARGLLAYPADYDDCLPPYGADVAKILEPYAPRIDKACPLNHDPNVPSYTVSPIYAGKPVGSTGETYGDMLALIETDFRHEFRGKRYMAAAYLNARGGTATPDDLVLPH